MIRHFWLALVAICVEFPLLGQPVPAEKAWIVVDAQGESIRLKTVRFTAGVRKMAWLGEAKTAPLAFELREPGSTTYVQGVLSLIPLNSLKSLTYHPEKKVMMVHLAGQENPLTGSMEFVGLNIIGLEAEVEQGTAGVAVVKYRGGILKGGIQSITFPDPQPYVFKAKPDGPDAEVRIADAKALNPTLKVKNLQPLYRFPDGSEKRIPMLPFQKTLKLNWADIVSMKAEPAEKKGAVPDLVVTTKDGKPQTLSPLTSLEVEGKKATLLGLLGETPQGYKLIPLHTLADYLKVSP